MSIVYEQQTDHDYSWIIIEEPTEFKIAVHIFDRMKDIDMIIPIGFENTLDNCIEFINNKLI